jgi:hypothetical protein
MTDGQHRIVFLDHQQKQFIAPMKQMNPQQYLNSPIPPHSHLMPNYHQGKIKLIKIINKNGKNDNWS